MTDPSPVSARLYALIGDAIQDLPPLFINRLERILAAPGSMGTTTKRVVNLFREQNPASAADEQRSDGRPISVFHQTRAASISRRLAGLSAIVQVPEAAHHRREGESAEPVLGAHLVEGLLMAGRELFDSVDEDLCGVR